MKLGVNEMEKCYIDVITEVEIIKDSLIDLSNAHGWFVESTYTARRLKNMEQVQLYSCGYVEHRIHCEHMMQLLDLHIKDLNETIKTLSQFEQQKDAPIVTTITNEA